MDKPKDLRGMLEELTFKLLSPA